MSSHKASHVRQFLPQICWSFPQNGVRSPSLRRRNNAYFWAIHFRIIACFRWFTVVRWCQAQKKMSPKFVVKRKSSLGISDSNAGTHARSADCVNTHAHTDGSYRCSEPPTKESGNTFHNFVSLMQFTTSI